MSYHNHMVSRLSNVYQDYDKDNNYFENKKDFRKLFRTLTEKPHSFMVVNYSNPSEKMYMNNHFQPVGKCGKPKNGECKCP